MNPKWMASLVVSLALASCLAMAGSAQQQGQVNVAAVGDTSCDYTFAYAPGNGFNWCLSSNGNIMRLEAPASPLSEHIRVGTFTEGYAICDWTGGGSLAYDYGSTQSGFGPTSILSGCVGGALPCAMQRQTSDGRFRLTMVFNRTAGDREIVITETVKNLRNIHTDNVEVWRYADTDVNASAGNDWGDRSLSSAWARDVTAPQSGQRVGLSALTRNVFHSTNILGPTPPTNSLCTTSDPGPLPHYGDIGIFLSYDLQEGLGALKSKTVKFQYRVD